MSSSKRKSLPTKISQTRNSDDSLVSLNHHNHHHNSVLTNDTSSSKSPSYDSERDEDEETEYQSEDEELPISPSSLVAGNNATSKTNVKGFPKKSSSPSSSSSLLKNAAIEQTEDDEQLNNQILADDDIERDDEEDVDDEEDEDECQTSRDKMSRKLIGKSSAGFNVHSPSTSPCKKVSFVCITCSCFLFYSLTIEKYSLSHFLFTLSE